MKIVGLISIVVIVVAVILLSRGSAVAFDEITEKELKEKMAKGGVTLLDVRENDEVANCKIPESIHIPLAEVNKRFKELDPTKEIVVYCAAGVRSARASKVLDGAGFKNVKNLKGGIRNWVASGGAIVGPCK